MRPQLASRDTRIAAIAARQHGVVSMAQLRAVGVDKRAVARAVQRGALHTLHRGVYAVGHPAPSGQGRWVAAVLAIGGGPHSDAAGPVIGVWGAALSHRSAAELWALLPPAEGDVDVLVAGDGGRATRAGIRLHRSTSLSRRDVTMKEGIPVTTSARTIDDIRRAVVRRRPDALSPRELRRAIREAEVAGLPLRASVTTDRTRSDLERDFLRLCRRHRLPLPLVNVRVGRWLVDFLWPAHRLVVETDFWGYHRGSVAFEDDHARELDLRALGYHIRRFTDRQIDSEPERVVADLRATLSLDVRPGTPPRH